VRLNCSGPRPPLPQRQRVVTGVVVISRRSSGSGMDTVRKGSQIAAKRPSQPRPFSCLGTLNARPPEALRRLATTAARALRESKWQPHLEREVRPQKIRKIGAVGAKDDLHLVLAESQMIEQEIARSIAQHFVQRRPRWRGIERRVKELLYPSRKQVFGRPIPRIAHRPDAACSHCRPRRLVVANGDFARDRTAFDRSTISGER